MDLDRVRVPKWGEEVKETIGVWNGDFRYKYAVWVEDGVMRTMKVFGIAGDDRKQFKRDFGERFFGDSEFFIGVRDELMTSVLRECNGETLDGVEKVAEKYKARREERRAARREEDKRWDALRGKFGGAVIGIDKDIDVYASGFSVRVIFASDMNFKDRSKFLRENKSAFIKWVMAEIEDSKKISRRIGSVKFYKPVEITNLRVQEVEVKFDVKMEGIA